MSFLNTQRTKNLSYIQTFEDAVECTSSPKTINMFDPVTIQPNKKVSIDISIPTRCDDMSWGGLYVNLNVKINDTWYNLGNGGYDGGVMSYSAKMISRYNRHFLFDFISELGLPVNEPFSMQVELIGVTFSTTAIARINGSHEINNNKNGFFTRGDVHPTLGKQNFTTVRIEEMDR